MQWLWMTSAIPTMKDIQSEVKITPQDEVVFELISTSNVSAHIIDQVHVAMLPVTNSTDLPLQIARVEVEKQLTGSNKPL